MYTQFFGFKEKPLNLTPDPHFLYMSTVHKRALAYLTYGLDDRKGFITITGEIGAGKTTLIRALIKQLDENTTVSRVINTKVTSIQLLKMIVRDFDIECAKEDGKEDILESLNQFLLDEYAVGHTTVLIIDEAQNLHPSTLEEIRLLSNLETEKDKLLQIILVGQPELRDILALPELKQLRQRITVGYHLTPLNQNEIRQYIRHRIAVAGAPNPDIFSKEAMDYIYHPSAGVPRLINIICDACLVTAFVENCHFIEEEMVKGVISELDLVDFNPQDHGGNVKGASFSHIPALVSEVDQNTKLEEISQKVNELYELQDSNRLRQQRILEEEQKLFEIKKDLEQKLKKVEEMEKRLEKREEQRHDAETHLGVFSNKGAKH
jgi:putative secretion ATPase (PEP-CTERM system associated)